MFYKHYKDWPQVGLVQDGSSTFTPTCSRWYDHEWLKADYKPDLSIHPICQARKTFGSCGPQTRLTWALPMYGCRVIQKPPFVCEIQFFLNCHSKTLIMNCNEIKRGVDNFLNCNTYSLYMYLPLQIRPTAVEREYMYRECICNFWNFGQWPSFVPWRSAWSLVRQEKVDSSNQTKPKKPTKNKLILEWNPAAAMSWHDFSTISQLLNHGK